MKKIISTVLTLTLVLALAACGANTTNIESNNNDVVQETSNTTKWKDFINEYEEWVDDYIEITEKYKANPSDLSILSDYTDMMAELTEWTTKTEDMEKELEGASASELAEYSSELARIAGKLAEAAY